jgi:hypothetical protein
MTTVKQVDSLVVSDDAVAARLWPRLGPKVQRAYLADRDGWVVLRRRVEAGETLPQVTLVAQQKVFAGWARAFRAAGASGTKRRPVAARRQPATVRRQATAVPPAAAAAAVPLIAPAPAVPRAVAAIPTPALATVAKPGGGAGAGAAVAGGLALAGIIAFAARRKRA